MTFHYQFDFAERLIESAGYLVSNSIGKNEAGRAILYFSKLSCEISLKALLERAGYTIKELKKFSHNLDELLKEVGSCKLTNTGCRATELRAKSVTIKSGNITVGVMLDAEKNGASRYPSEIRYGLKIKDYPVDAVLSCAKIVSHWCIANKNNLTR